MGQRRREPYLLDGHLVGLAPLHGYPGVQVVELTGAQGDRLVLVLVRLLDLELLELLEQALHGLLGLVVRGALPRPAAVLHGLLGVFQRLLRRLNRLLLLLQLRVQVAHGLLVGLRHGALGRRR